MKLFAWMVVVLLLSSVVFADEAADRAAEEQRLLQQANEQLARGTGPLTSADFSDAKSITVFYGTNSPNPNYYGAYDVFKKEALIIITDNPVAPKGYAFLTPDAYTTLKTSISEENRHVIVSDVVVNEFAREKGLPVSTDQKPQVKLSGTFATSDGKFQSKVSGDAIELQYKKTVPILDKDGKETGQTKDVYVTFGKAKVSKLQEQYAVQDVSSLLNDADFMNAAVLFRQQNIRIDDTTRSRGVYYYGGSSELFLQDSAVYKNADGSVTYIEGDFEFDEKDQLKFDGDTPKYQKNDDYTIVTRDGTGKVVSIVDKDVTGGTDDSTLYAAVLIIDPVTNQPTYRVMTQENDKSTGQTDYPYVTIPGAGVTGVQLYADDKGNRVFYNPDTGKYFDKEGKDLTDDSFVESDKKAAFDKAKELMGKDRDVRVSQNPTNLEYLGRLLTQDFFAFLGQIFAGYQQWRGLGAYGGLFLKDQIGEWRADVDELFCKAYLGTDCVVEKLCEKTSARSTGDNVVVTASPSSGIKAAAYVQAERSEPAIFKDEKGTHEQYLYKITYYAASPDTENAVQLTFKYSGGSYAWYPTPVKVSKGGAVSAQGTSAIVAYSDKRYTEVCVELQNAIDTGTGGKASRACTEIVSSGVNPSGEDPEEPINESAVPSDVSDVDVADGEDAAVPEEAPVTPGAGF